MNHANAHVVRLVGSRLMVIEPSPACLTSRDRCHVSWSELRVEKGEDMPDRYELQRFLWDVRHDVSIRVRARQDRVAVLAEYQLEPEESAALAALDCRTLLEMGANPMLVYFGAMELGVDRDQYYALVGGSTEKG